MNTKSWVNLLLTLFILGIICIDLPSCGKKVECPGFTDTLLVKWFPYKDNERLVFVNNMGEKDTFTLVNTWTTEPHHIYTNSEPHQTCLEVYKEFLAKKYQQNSNMYIRMSVISDDNEISKNTAVKINGSYFYCYNLTDTGFAYIKSTDGRITTIDHYSTITINNRTFTNIHSASIDTTLNKSAEVYKFYFGEDQGIVAYEEYPSLKIWAKQ